MKRIYLILLTVLVISEVNAQCNSPISITPSSSCFSAHETLSVSGAMGASQLRWATGGVVVYTASPSYLDTALVVAGGNTGSAANQLSSPLDMQIDASGNIYVCDEGNNRIQMFPAGSTSATNAVTVAGGNGAGSGANQLDDPRGMYIDASGNIYVADSHNHRIQKFPAGSTSATNAVTVAGGNGAGSAANQLDYPQDVYLDIVGNIYIADMNNFRVQKFPAGSSAASSGTTVAGGSPGPGLNQLSQITSILVDNSFNLYVLDQTGERVLKFPPGSTSSTNGIDVAGDNGGGSGANQFYIPKGMFLDGYGNLYVADQVNNRIQKFPSGSTSATNGITILSTVAGYAIGQINQPAAIYIDASGNLYELDAGNGRVQKFSIMAVTNDTTYTPTSPGTYTAFVQNGCSASATVYLQATQNYTYTYCAGSSVTVGTHIYTSPGTYVDTLIGVSMHGCDSIVTTNLSFYPQDTFTQTVAFCQGGSIMVGGHTYTASNTYIDTLSGAGIHGCDSILTTHLTVYPAATYSINATICPGQGYTFGGQTHNTAGVFTDTLHGASVLGCDSIISLNLNLYPAPINNISTSICRGQSYSLGNHIYYASGTYTDTLPGASAHGCDSVVTLVLVVDTAVVYDLYRTICAGQAYIFGGHSYNAPGVFRDTIYYHFGCDSLITVLHLSIDTVTAYFTLQPSSTPHQWYAIDLSFGSGTLSYIWNWGDSTAYGIGAYPTHVYASPNYYNVCVSVTDSQMCTANYCDTNVYLYKDDGSQMVYLNIVQQVPSGISNISNAIAEVSYYNHAIHLSIAIDIPSTVKLYDISGRLITAENNFTGDLWAIEPAIPKGAYIFYLQNDNCRMVQKLIIK